jgi:UDP-glucuronate decarboxylase
MYYNGNYANYKFTPNGAILVTGGAGFIGSHFCKHLLSNIKKEDVKIICIDNLYSGRMSNIFEIKTNERFKFYKIDIRHEKELEVLNNYNFDYIFNFACPASPIHYQKEPIFTLETSFVGTRNLLELAVRNNSIFFQASTSEVYGDPMVHPQTEEYFGNVNPIGIRACYDEGKRSAEALCFDYHRKYGIQIRVGRIFNTYGENMSINDGRVISEFIVNALKGKNLVVNGDGTQTRSFCYVSDLISLIDIFVTNNENFFGPCNLGNPTEFKIIDLAEKIISNVNDYFKENNIPQNYKESQSKIIHEKLPENDPLQRKPNIDKITRLYYKNRQNLENCYSYKGLDEVLPTVIRYFDEIL